MQNGIWTAAKKSHKFFVDAMCWTYDPRNLPAFPAKQPFILFPAQEIALDEIFKSMGEGYDILIHKSRDMGATWLCCIAYVYKWIFVDDITFLCASRKEDLVDDKENPDAIFWKIDYLLKYLPNWFLGRSHFRAKLKFKNENNGATITGESTTGDLARGGRRTSIFLDEFGMVPNGDEVLAATADVTYNRIFNSTPKGTANALYAIYQNPYIKTVRLMWWDHPTKRLGLYTTRKERIEIIDANYKFPDKYPFILGEEGKFRSPWYDTESKRRSKQQMAQEIDADFLGSGSSFFDTLTLSNIEKNDVIEPFAIGDLDFLKETCEPRKKAFIVGGRKRLRLWLILKDNKPLSDERFVVGADISAGTGASNSCLSVVNVQTAVKVAEYTAPDVFPEEFARIAVALCRFFNDAFLIWEANGPGRNFGGKVMEFGYSDVYYRRNEASVAKTRTSTPGWYSTPGNKEDLLGNYRGKLAEKKFINRSAEAVRECYYYQYITSNRIGIPGKIDEKDPSGARDQHGDRVIADALACYILDDLPGPEYSPRHFDHRSFAGRKELYREKQASLAASGWE